jgi:hypothetical protein
MAIRVSPHGKGQPENYVFNGVGRGAADTGLEEGGGGRKGLLPPAKADE